VALPANDSSVISEKRQRMSQSFGALPSSRISSLSGRAIRFTTRPKGGAIQVIRQTSMVAS
jgi:hypothetical protein